MENGLTEVISNENLSFVGSDITQRVRPTSLITSLHPSPIKKKT